MRVSQGTRGGRVGRRGIVAGTLAAGLAAYASLGGDTAGAAAGATAVPANAKLSHLLRRAGFGNSPADLAPLKGLSLSAAVDRLVDYDTVDNSALDGRLKAANFDFTKRDDLERWWYTRMIYTARPLEEKMTLFWHMLLTSAVSKVGLKSNAMLDQNYFFRTNALGSFPDILKGVSRDPAMMIWLDTATNRKGHANENYARELMELFTLGVGNYTEQDVQEGARAFTGWSLRAGQFFFNKNQHDTGQKKFLGQVGNFDGNDVVDIIVKQPTSASFIVNKLFSFFAYPNPTDAVLQPFVDTYTASGYSIRETVRAILKSDAFYSPQAYRGIVKNPVDLIAGTMRTLGVETDAKGLPALGIQMGQEIFDPPNVAGWPGGSAWLTSGTWLARLNFANRVAALVPGNKAAAGSNAAAAVDGVVNLLLDGQLDPTQRQVLLDYAAPLTDERRRGLLYLAMGLPEYHLV